MSASGTSAPWPAIQSASAVAHDAIRCSLLPAMVSVVTGESAAAAGPGVGPLFDHDVCVRPADTERRYGSPARAFLCRPRAELGGHEQPGGRRVDRRVPMRTG